MFVYLHFIYLSILSGCHGVCGGGVLEGPSKKAVHYRLSVVRPTLGDYCWGTRNRAALFNWTALYMYVCMSILGIGQCRAGRAEQSKIGWQNINPRRYASRLKIKLVRPFVRVFHVARAIHPSCSFVPVFLCWFVGLLACWFVGLSVDMCTIFVCGSSNSSRVLD